MKLAAQLLLAFAQQQRDLAEILRRRRVSAPSKMTSCILPPRSALALCSPRTQRIASAILLLPQPFGAHDGRDTGIEAEDGGISERLEAVELERL
jgi:hypothetical protein